MKPTVKMSRVTMNISGRHFEFNSDILTNVQTGRLKALVKDAKDNGKELAFAVNRSADSFEAVLTFYETGVLHLPTSVCPGLFLEELKFWEISDDELSDCCSYRLHTFLDEMETRRNFKKDNSSLLQKYTTAPTLSTCVNFQKIRRKVWAIVDFQENTIPAKVYYIAVITMVMFSILALALRTEPSMKRSLTKCEILEYLKHSDDPDYEIVHEHFDYIDCSGTDSSDIYEDIFNGGVEVDDGEGGTRTIVLQELTVPSNVFSVFEIVFVVYFSIDMLLRLLSCPSIPRYFLYVLNIIDVLALTTSYALLIVLYIEKEHQYEESWLHILKYFQILRALRLLRVVKTFRASQVLAYSVRENIKDLVILALLMFLGLSIFSCLIYFAESRDTVASIPVGWYWSVITLTTVGYGDITPKTTAGRFIACLCAVLGVVLMAVTVPIFVNNFLSLYQYAVVEELIYRRKKGLSKKLDASREERDQTNGAESSQDVVHDSCVCNDKHVVFSVTGNETCASATTEAWK